MRAGRPDAEPEALRGVGDLAPQPAQQLPRLVRVAHRRYRDLEHGLQQLRLDVLRVAAFLEQRVDRVHE
jgi:hypothetical protein